MIIETTKFADVSKSTELYQRLDAECEKAPEHLKDVYFVIANYIRERVSENPSLAPKLQGKTIKEAYGKIEDEARAIYDKTKGKCIPISPEKWLAIVGKYCFGEGAPVSPPAPAPVIIKKEEKSEIADIFDLI